LVEFALVLPVFLLMFFGLIDIGRYVYTANALSQAAREGARFGSVGSWSTTCANTREQCIRNETLGRLAGVPGAAVKVTCQHLVASKPSPSNVADCRSNDLLGVEVDADFEILTPIIGQLLGQRSLSGTALVAVNQ
jgi:Flp pilus assembly protein TadG